MGRRLLSLIAAGSVALACGEDTPTSLEEIDDDLFVTWHAVVLNVGGQRLYDEGTRAQWTFDGAGNWTLNVVRDGSGFFCDEEDGPGWDCIQTGQFTGSQTELVLLGEAGEEGEADEEDVSFDMTITVDPARLVLQGVVDATSVRMEFVVPPLPDLIGTWAAHLLMEGSEMIQDNGAPTNLSMTFEPDGTFSYVTLFSPANDEASNPFCGFIFCYEVGFYEVDPESELLTINGESIIASVSLSGLVLQHGNFYWDLQKVDVPSPFEEGSWVAFEATRNGSDILLNGLGTFFAMSLNGLRYGTSTGPGEEQPRFLCDFAAPELCESTGSYEATLSRLTLTSDETGGEVAFTVESGTPLFLELAGSIDGNQYRFKLGRRIIFPEPPPE